MRLVGRRRKGRPFQQSCIGLVLNRSSHDVLFPLLLTSATRPACPEWAHRCPEWLHRCPDRTPRRSKRPSGCPGRPPGLSERSSAAIVPTLEIPAFLRGTPPGTACSPGSSQLVA